MSRPAAILRGAALVLAAASCASERHLVVLSDPPGATVRLDNEVVGVTPLDHRFEHFGGRRLTLYLEGYQPALRDFELAAPWYARSPANLFTELVLPVGYRVVHVERFELVPESPRLSEPDLAGVLERAERLRRGGLTGPRPGASGPAPQPAPEAAPPPTPGSVPVPVPGPTE